MKKIAFFVEGLTEQLFIEKLLKEMFKKKKISIELRQIRGGSSIPTTIKIIKSSNDAYNKQFYILIYDCGGENSVASHLRDNNESLVRAGYKKIIGIRDVYPNYRRNDIPRLLHHLYYGISEENQIVKYILAIMEIEAWFLADDLHYEKMNHSLSRRMIIKYARFDPKLDDAELIDEPAKKLDYVYELVGMHYMKKRNVILRTINALDYNNLQYEVTKRNDSLKRLINEINSAFQ